MGNMSLSLFQDHKLGFDGPENVKAEDLESPMTNVPERLDFVISNDLR